MLSPSRLSRLLTAGIASCAVTWALAASASAQPIVPLKRDAPHGAPAYKVATGDHSIPVVAGKTAPPPGYKVAAGDHSVPSAADSDHVIALGRSRPTRVVAGTAATDGNTDTVALILSIVAILTACGAVTLTVSRPRRHTVGA